MLKYGQLKLSYGPQFVTSCLYLSSWLIYGIIDKKYIYSSPIFLGISLLYLWSYLIISK